MMIFWPLFLIAFTFAQSNCMGPGKKKDIGQELHLSVQDQDGLGTCYANAASLMLQGTLKSEKPISYQQLALIQSVGKARKSKVTDQQFVVDGEKGERLSNEGGNVCTTFQAAQEFGFCDSDQFQFDQMGSTDPNSSQKTALAGFGRFIDKLSINRAQMTELDWKNFEGHLANTLWDKKKDCSLKTKDEFIQAKLERWLPSYVLKRISSIEGQLERAKTKLAAETTTEGKTNVEKKVKDQEARLDVWRKIQEQSLVSTPRADQGKEWKLTPAMTQNLKASIKTWSDPKYKIEGSQINGESSVTPLFDSPTSLFFKDLKLDAESPQLASEKKKETGDAYSKRTVTLFNSHRDRCNSELDEGVIAELQEKMSTGPCDEAVGNKNEAFDKVAQDAKEITEFIKNMDFGDYSQKVRSLLKLISPACLEQGEKNKAKLQNLSCRELYLTSSETDKNPLPAEEKISSVRLIAGRRICEGKPVPVTVCSEFMREDAPLDTDFCKNRKEGADANKHSRHVMSIVGQEISTSGAVRYLVQNSWGRECGFNNPEAKGVVCEKDASGQPTGRFWIDESLLLKNTSSVYFLEEKK